MESVILSGRGPVPVCSLLLGTHTGSVRLVTSAGIYLELEKDIVLLCRESWGVVPIGVCLTPYRELLKLNPEAGQPVSIREGWVFLPSGSARLWLTPVKRFEKNGGIRADSLDKLVRELAAESRQAGLAPLAARVLLDEEMLEAPNPYCAAALPGLMTLFQGVTIGSKQQIEQGVGALLGLGPGLTPSGDDVLCGILYVLLRSGASRTAGVKMLADSVRMGAPLKTNAVSAAYLTAIASGEDYDRMQNVWLGMTGQGAAQAGRLLEVGSCSGGDMLFGMLAAGKLLDHMEENKYGRPYRAGSLG